MQAKQQSYVAVNAQSTNDWPGIAIQMAAATILSGVIAYVATNPQQLAHAVAETHAYTPEAAPAPAIAAPPRAAPADPVLVKNPFDASEVFQFPSGTSETEAHMAVASLLLQRARDRQHLWARMGHRNKNSASRTQSGEADSVPASNQIPASHSPSLQPIRLMTTQARCRSVDGATAAAAVVTCS